MIDIYQEWIDKVVGRCFFEKKIVNGKTRYLIKGSVGKADDGEPLIQRCDLVAPMMALAFPELKVVVGECCSDSTKNVPMYHCWCVTPDGTIIDPTKAQFKNFDNTYSDNETYMAKE